MLNTSCNASINTVCQTVYDDNPPFACTRDVYPSLLAVFSNAFAGAEFALVLFSTAVMVLFVSLLPYIFGKSVLHEDMQHEGEEEESVLVKHDHNQHGNRVRVAPDVSGNVSHVTNEYGNSNSNGTGDGDGNDPAVGGWVL